MEASRTGAERSDVVVEAADRLAKRVASAASPRTLWSERIEIGLAATLEFLDDELWAARVLILEQPGRAVRLLTTRLERAIGEVLDAARQELIVGARLRPSSPLIAELLTSALVSALRGPLVKGHGRTASAAAPELMSFIVGPYLDKAARRADALAGHTDEQMPGASAEVVPIRATSSHLLTLEALAQGRGLRNRDIIIAANLSGSGEASQLLKRLCQRGLIEYAGASGRSRTWTLTMYGRRVLEVLSPQRSRTPRGASALEHERAA